MYGWLRLHLRTLLRELRQRFPDGAVRPYKVGRYTYERKKVAGRWVHVSRYRKKRTLSDYNFVGGREQALRNAALAYRHITGGYVTAGTALNRLLLMGGIRHMPKGTDVYVERSSGELSVSLVHPQFGAISYNLPLRRGGVGGLYFRSADIYDTKRGTGTKIFADMVESARRMGLKNIRLFAARMDDKNGYYTWVRLGADNTIRDVLLETGVRPPLRVLEPLSRYDTLAEAVARSRIVRDWWRESGTGVDLEFSFAPGSVSLKVLRGYIRSKKIKLDGREYNGWWGRG